MTTPSDSSIPATSVTSPSAGIDPTQRFGPRSELMLLAHREPMLLPASVAGAGHEVSTDHDAVAT